MNKYLLVSLAMTPAAVSPVPATQPTFIVDGMHAYNFDKLGDDLIEGIKRKQIFITTPNDTRIDNFTHFFKDSANASDVNVVEILSTFERMLQKNPTVDLSEKIKVIASNLTFTNFVFDKDTNEGIIRSTLVPKILADLKTVEGQIIDLKAAEVAKVEKLLTEEAKKLLYKIKKNRL